MQADDFKKAVGIGTFILDVFVEAHASAEARASGRQPGTSFGEVHRQAGGATGSLDLRGRLQDLGGIPGTAPTTTRAPPTTPAPPPTSSPAEDLAAIFAEAQAKRDEPRADARLTVASEDLVMRTELDARLVGLASVKDLVAMRAHLDERLLGLTREATTSEALAALRAHVDGRFAELENLIAALRDSLRASASPPGLASPPAPAPTYPPTASASPPAPAAASLSPTASPSELGTSTVPPSSVENDVAGLAAELGAPLSASLSTAPPTSSASPPTPSPAPPPSTAPSASASPPTPSPAPPPSTTPPSASPSELGSPPATAASVSVLGSLAYLLDVPPTALDLVPDAAHVDPREVKLMGALADVLGVR